MGKKSWERLCEEREFNAFYQALAQQSGFEQIGRFLQHGSTTRLMHSVAVAYYSYRLAKITRLSFHWEEMVRGALLHDYFLYDAQDGDPAHKWHWTRHPGIAAENAKREMPLTAIEEDTIRCHMFPLTVKPPKYREGVVVSLVDKACSVYEFFPGGRLMPNCRRMLRVFPLWLALKSSFCFRKWQGKGCNSLA